MNTITPDNTIHRETRWLHYFSPTLIVCATTGIITHLTNNHAVWQQWTQVIHVLSAIMLSLISLPYLMRHIHRSLGLRRGGVLFSGITALLVLLVVLASGFHMLINGQKEALRWIYQAHVYTGYTVLIIILLHLWWHAQSLSAQRIIRQRRRFLTLNKHTGFHIAIYGIVTVVTLWILSQLYHHFAIEYRTDPVVKHYQYNYGEHPFRPSQTETFNNTFIDQRLIANSHTCEPCHQSITAQWRASMHRQAASDQTYVTNINLLANNKGISATRYCEGCHAPVALLSGQLSEGGTHGGQANTAAFDEGVGCMGCHGIERLVHDKGVASYLYRPATDYLFANRQNRFARGLHNFLIRINPKQHRLDMAREVLAKPELCASCHTQFMDETFNNWGWVKMQDEYRAWLDSPFSGQSDQTFAHVQTQRCQDCHMPLIAGEDPSANAQGLLVSHRSLGANTAIPWINNDQQQFQLTKQFLQTGKIRVTIDSPNRVDAIRDPKFVEETLLSPIEAPAFVYLNETLTIKTTISNLGVGHDFPGGTTDINEAWLWFRVVDAQNQPVFERGQLNADDSVDTAAVFFRSLPIDRQGKLVWKHDLFNMIGESYKKTIASGSSDIIEHQFTVPSWAKSPLTISAVLRYRKFNQRYAQWALKEKYQPLPIVDMAWDAIELPIKIKPPVETVR